MITIIEKITINGDTSTHVSTFANAAAAQTKLFATFNVRKGLPWIRHKRTKYVETVIVAKRGPMARR